MYMFDFLSRVIALDFVWFAWLFFANLYYIFLYAALVYFFFNPKGVKKWVVGFFIVIFLIWFSVDFVSAIGWTLFVATFFWVHYVSKMAVMSFSENDPKLKKHLTVINSLQYIAILIVFNLFLIYVM